TGFEDNIDFVAEWLEQCEKRLKKMLARYARAQDGNAQPGQSAPKLLHPVAFPRNDRQNRRPADGGGGAETSVSVEGPVGAMLKWCHERSSRRAGRLVVRKYKPHFFIGPTGCDYSSRQTNGLAPGRRGRAARIALSQSAQFARFQVIFAALPLA